MAKLQSAQNLAKSFVLSLASINSCSVQRHKAHRTWRQVCTLLHLSTTLTLSLPRWSSGRKRDCWVWSPEFNSQIGSSIIGGFQWRFFQLLPRSIGLWRSFIYFWKGSVRLVLTNLLYSFSCCLRTFLLLMAIVSSLISGPLKHELELLPLPNSEEIPGMMLCYHSLKY